MKKKFGSIIMAGMLACTMTAGIAFAGCGNVAAPDIDIPEGGYDGSEVTVKFYHTMGSNLSDVLDEYIVEFNKLYPNIHIQWEAVGGYDDVRNQISTEITVGNQPNMAYCYPDHVALYNTSGAVQTLDTLINSDIKITRADNTTESLGLTKDQINDFIPGYYQEGRQFGDERMYTLPFSKSTEVLYYNKTFFEANQIKVPETWDELGDACQKILDKTGGKTADGKTIFPLGYDSEANWFITMCEQYGSPYTSATGDHFLFNNDKNKEFVSKFKGWYDKGYFTTQAINGTYTSNLFVAQESFMSIGSSAGATHQRPSKVGADYPFEVGIAPIPQVNKDKPKAISQGPSICIFKKENPQEVLATWLFAKYLTTDVAFQASFSNASGYVPVLKSVADFPAYKTKLDKADGGDNIAYLSAKVCMEQANAYYTSPAFNGSSKARDEVGSLIQAVFTGSKTLEQAFKDAIDECEYFAG